MSNSKAVSSPLIGYFRLSSKQYLTSEEEKWKMCKIPYASTVGSLIYAMMYTRSEIAYAVGIVSRFFFNPEKEHQATVKQILRYLKDTFRVCLPLVLINLYWMDIQMQT